MKQRTSDDVARELAALGCCDDMPRMATLTANTISANAISAGTITSGDTGWYDGDTFHFHGAMPTPIAYPDNRGWRNITGKGDSIMKAKDEVRKRLVFVAVVDTHPDLDDEASVVYLDDTPIVTSGTDQEIWMGLNISALLQLHNEGRATVLDKEASRAAGRNIYLEPARIRDLCMAVIPLATFD